MLTLPHPNRPTPVSEMPIVPIDELLRDFDTVQLEPQLPGRELADVPTATDTVSVSELLTHPDLRQLDAEVDERLDTVGSVEFLPKGLVKADEVQDGKRRAIGKGEPLLTAEQVQKRLGIGLGRLEAVIRLRQPGVADNPQAENVYCFGSVNSGKHEREKSYIIITDEQLTQLLTAVRTHGVEDTYIGAITELHEGDKLKIGRSHWLPRALGAVAQHANNTDLDRQYAQVSREHAELTVEDGVLILTDKKSKNGTRVSDASTLLRIARAK